MADLAPAFSKMGARKLRRRKRPEVAVAAPIRAQRSHSSGNTQKKDMGMKMDSE